MMVPWHIKFFYLWGFIFLLSPANSGFAWDIKIPEKDTLIGSFFKNLYNFSFGGADSMVVVMNNSNIDNVTFFNVKANLAWWKLLSGDEIETNLKACDSSIHESIRLGLKNKHMDISSLLNIIYSYSLKARLENYKGNILKSFIYFYKSITYIEECIDRPVKDDKLNLVLGLYYYFIDYIENEYFMMRTVFFPFPKGDKNIGLGYLEKCLVSSDEMIRTEANYFLLKIYAYAEKDYSKAYENARTLTQQYPNNLVYKLEQFKLLLILKKTGEAQIFQKKLIEEIQAARNINNIQKNHFLSQIEELTITAIK